MAANGADAADAFRVLMPVLDLADLERLSGEGSLVGCCWFGGCCCCCDDRGGKTQFGDFSV